MQGHQCTHVSRTLRAPDPTASGPTAHGMQPTRSRHQPVSKAALAAPATSPHQGPSPPRTLAPPRVLRACPTLQNIGEQHCPATTLCAATRQAARQTCCMQLRHTSTQQPHVECTRAPPTGASTAAATSRACVTLRQPTGRPPCMHPLPCPRPTAHESRQTALPAHSTVSLT